MNSPHICKGDLLTGTQMNYLYVCPVKLWYFSHHVSMEHSSDLVASGRFLHETSYSRDSKEVRMPGIALDFVRKGDVLEVHEVKKSPKMEKAHEMQALYYIYLLKKSGVRARAVIDYPLLRKKRELELSPESEKEVMDSIAEISRLISLPVPPSASRKPFCPKCAYYELCWSE